jgi:hypothetical protein
MLSDRIERGKQRGLGFGQVAKFAQKITSAVLEHGERRGAAPLLGRLDRNRLVKEGETQLREAVPSEATCESADNLGVRRRSVRADRDCHGGEHGALAHIGAARLPQMTRKPQQLREGVVDLLKVVHVAAKREDQTPLKNS